MVPPSGKLGFCLCLNSQCNGARLQIKGLGVPQLHLQTLRGPDAARHHPHLHEGREGLTPPSGRMAPWRQIQTFTDTGSGPGAPLVLKAAPAASQSKFNPHHKLFRSARPRQESQELGNEGALPHYLGCWYCIHVPSLAIALRPAH